MTTRTKDLLSITAVIAFIFLTLACGSKKSQTDNASSISTPNIASNNPSAAVTQEQTKSNWKYDEDTDKMSGEKTYYATCNSTNQIEFEFPYNGGSVFTIVIGNTNNENDVMINVTKGQFMPNDTHSEHCRIKFDDEKPAYIDYISSTRGNFNIIKIPDPGGFIAKLKQAKKVMIEAPFYKAGYQIMEFNVAGLIWNK